ncbi:coiled-coil domain-containing protein [Pontimicrobium aquaticum]|uniref:Uncharacterized protein n=1 Tax=Pontimicrobium aquaticum TaxID=2565367 RepID=A0A4U0F1A3_9FLAO|nr:hypothetical protein [Pontimicrobium aquaticum]TJY38038.1 hypothetical protein E5167_01925 [Pontimicrobium aquaticum]
MIVNPQVFNYRFTIGTLVVAITALIVYSYSSYTSAQSKEAFFKQEKKLLESQTSKIITSYDKLDSINKRLKLELDNSKQHITQTQDSLEKLQANMSLIYQYRNELISLKKQQSHLLKKEDSFSIVNNELSKQNASISKILNEQLNVISNLKEEKAKLDNNLKKGALVTANSFKTTTFGIKNSGKLLETNKANKTKSFKIDFVLAENPLASIQEKEFYYQIIGPDNNVVSDKGAIEFDRSSLIYSYKTSVLYSKNTLDVSVNIGVEETLKSGRYLVNIFDNNKRVGSTKIILQ